MFKKLTLGLLLCLMSISGFCDEGMWLPIHIKRLYNRDLQKMGLQLTPEEIYSINQSSLKDAIVSLGGFCTGEIVSNQGLMLTNHHCAFGSIQTHSSVDHDYLTDGFWAKTRSEELPNEKLYARFLVRMEDVTRQVLSAVNEEMSAKERAQATRKVMEQLKSDAEEGTHYNVQVKSFYEGNEYYLFVYETFRDVRLVGAPPSAIGKFGGDTDNWMWPRHTGDFSMFRVYMSPDGKPAEYSPNNVPLKPKHHLPVSLDGVKEGDFAMILGFPGSTDRYLTSWGIDLALSKKNPTMIKIFQTRLETLKAIMNKNPKVRIQYASKYASLSNYWKYLIGQSKGLRRLHVYEEKQAIEEKFRNWINESPERQKEYGDVLSSFKNAYESLKPQEVPFRYAALTGRLIESMRFAEEFGMLETLLEADTVNQEKVKATVKNLKESAKKFYKDYSPATDEQVFANMLRLYYENIPAGDNRPEFFKAMQKAEFSEPETASPEAFKALARYVYQNSVFTSEEKLNSFLNNPKKGIISSDPVTLATEALAPVQMRLFPAIRQAYGQLVTAKRLFIKGIREENPEKLYYPDANSTMRFTYGSVGSYSPQDAVEYNYYTTLKGVMEKEDPNNPEFTVPSKLKALYEAKDYGRYADADGTMHVGFISNNDITGGNSGSPVINGKGQLIGTAFDGNWEAMSGDIAFEPNLQRTISVDIRYTLFVIDKFAGAGHLVEEMTLVKSEPPYQCPACKKGKKCKKCRKKAKKKKRKAKK